MGARTARVIERHAGSAPSAPQQEDVDALMAGYVETQSIEIRDRVAMACTPLVRRIASEFAFSGVPVDDLIQVGYIGLLNAIAAFDPTRGAKFATYASYLVRGEIRHYLRDQRDTIRKPRWLQKINNQIEQTVSKYVSETGRFPGIDELSQELNIEEGGLLEVLRTREALRTVSLESSSDDDNSGELRVDRERIKSKSHISFQLPIEDRVILMDAMEQLNALQRKVLYYLFYTDLTQMEAARRIGISQKHVSRVLASAISKLRGLMAPSVGTS